jgi:hypothetical protein
MQLEAYRDLIDLLAWAMNMHGHKRNIINSKEFSVEECGCRLHLTKIQN